MSRIVVALGGNALGNTALEQKIKAKNTATAIVDLIEQGHELIITHGNGPQVGMINLAFETLAHDQPAFFMPFSECGAMSQGYIGFHLQNALQEEFNKRHLPNQVATILTQVVVDPNDSAFLHPTKPIGSFHTKEEAILLEKQKAYTMVEDAGRGYRRVVASPKPIDIVEAKMIEDLIKAKHTVIAVGGGGIPVVHDGYGYRGVDAVIDKDYASAKLADLINADILCILTAVPNVAIHFNTPQQINCHSLSVTQLKEYIAQGQFAKGSMLPKVEAALAFVDSNPHRAAIIAALEQSIDALSGKAGTKITYKGD